MKKYFIGISISFIVIFLFTFAFVFLYNPSGNFVYAAGVDYEEVQVRLKDWGYYNGAITGTNTQETKEAIKYFQTTHGLTESGVVDGATAEALGIYIGEQSSNDLYLLAKCIHAEARGEIYEGMVAVGAVILNRVASPEFPNTVYGVIYQPWAFTAVNDGQINLEPDAKAYQAAQDALNGWDPTYGCLFYYNPAVATSKWIYSRQVVCTIGRHVFAL